MTCLLTLPSSVTIASKFNCALGRFGRDYYSKFKSLSSVNAFDKLVGLLSSSINQHESQNCFKNKIIINCFGSSFLKQKYDDTHQIDIQMI